MTIYKVDFDTDMYYDPETGEVFESELEAIEMENHKKAVNAALWIKNLQYDVDAFEAEIKSLKQRMDAKKRTIESMKKYLVKLTGGEGFEETNVKVSFRESEAVVIEDEFLLPERYFRIKEKKEPDKKAIKQAIENGDVIYGAKIEKRQNVSVK